MSFDVRPPIHMSTTYLRKEGVESHIYSRTGNPNRDQLERELQELENGAEGVCFASGLAASMAVFSLLERGDHLLMPSQCYWGTLQQVRALVMPRGIEVDFVDMRDLDLIRSCIKKNTKMVFVETPSNPLLHISDIAGIAGMLQARNILFVCDNTVATGCLQRPLELGADISVFSTSKAINGHSDVIGGGLVLAQKNAHYERLREYQILGGAVPSPADCWLISRGLLTLSLRIQKQSQNAEELATFFMKHPHVKKVHYPLCFNHPQRELAKSQMAAGGGLMSIELADELFAHSFLKRLRRIAVATSLGGAETLAEHRASVEKGVQNIPPGLIRISTGLEEAQKLVEEFGQALEF